jgi:hypothetical protein
MGEDGMTWDVNLSHVQAGLPLKAKDMYHLGETSSYLIKVSDITLSMIISS